MTFLPQADARVVAIAAFQPLESCVKELAEIILQESTALPGEDLHGDLSLISLERRRKDSKSQLRGHFQHHAIPFFGAEVFALVTLAQSSPTLALFPIMVAPANIIFYHLLKAPTLQGPRLLDRIEGFKMFLSATEKDRLQRLVPTADRTPETYEKYLPYALALNVEQ